MDDGYSGYTLIRPALEQLRDLVAVGGVDQLYVHSPDRLARKYSYQVLLIEEFTAAGVEIIFLNHQLNHSPEDELLLQVQGIVAEYERAKFMERSRRGKRHAAQSGKVSVLAHAPYGYHYFGKKDGVALARYEVVPEEAQVVRQIFEWVGKDGLSLGEICRRLTQAGVPTRRGKPKWDRSVVWQMLQNPAYSGQAVFGRTRRGEWQPPLRPQRGHQGPPRHPTKALSIPKSEWIEVAVPALIDQSLFEAVAVQLEENRVRMRQRRRGVRHLLQGLIVCKQCGYAYYGTIKQQPTKEGTLREYGYYRCIGTEAYRFGGEPKCANLPLQKKVLEEVVWQKVCELLGNSAQLEEEYYRRLSDLEPQVIQTKRTSLENQLTKARQGLGRLIDAYSEGLLDKSEFEPRLKGQRQRIRTVEEELAQLLDAATMNSELRLIIGRLEEFAAKVKDGLLNAEWLTRREIMRTLIKRVEVDQQQVNVVFKVPPIPKALTSGENPSQDCRQRVRITFSEGGPATR